MKDMSEELWETWSTHADDWDGYGALPACQEAYSLADHIMQAVAATYKIEPYCITPIPNGGVVLEYREHDHIHLEIDGDLEIGYLIISGGPGTIYRFTEKHNITLARAMSAIEFIMHGRT